MTNGVSRFLARLRGVHPIVTSLFLHGGCYELHRILKTVWPEAEAWRDSDFHVYTKIGRHWYDIRGRRVAGATGLERMDAKIEGKARRWVKDMELNNLVRVEVR